MLTCAYDRKQDTSRWPRCAGKKAMWVSHGKADDTTARVEWIRGLLIVYEYICMLLSSRI